MRHPKKGIEKTVFLSEDMWTLLSEGRVWLTVYLSCWGSFVRAKHITVWWSFSWGQNASLLHTHTVLYIETSSDIPDHNNMKPTKRPPPVSFISVWIQAESIYFPVRYKVFSAKIRLVPVSAGSTHCLWKEILMHKKPHHYPISSVIRYFSFWADAFFLSVFSSPINIWLPGFENEAKCSGSSIEAPRMHVHTTYAPVTTDKMLASGAERHTDWFVECLGRLKQ